MAAKMMQFTDVPKAMPAKGVRGAKCHPHSQLRPHAVTDQFSNC